MLRWVAQSLYIPYGGMFVEEMKNVSKIALFQIQYKPPVGQGQLGLFNEIGKVAV
jgi:hypothetical protein